MGVLTKGACVPSVMGVLQAFGGTQDMIHQEADFAQAMMGTAVTNKSVTIGGGGDLHANAASDAAGFSNLDKLPKRQAPCVARWRALLAASNMVAARMWHACAAVDGGCVRSCNIKYKCSVLF